MDIAAAWSKCELCPRRCGVNRTAGERGWCKAADQVRMYAAAPHHGEEPPVSGKYGSGTMFFSHCTLHCLYCQNYPWSQLGKGENYNPNELADVFRSLRNLGCHNWNWVSPTPWLPALVDALNVLKAAGEPLLPVVYNTSGYERIETLQALEGRVAVYLADLRYAAAATARKGSEAENYTEVARPALKEMWRQTGCLKIQDDVAVSGLIVRILVLPGRQDEACSNLRWLADEFGRGVAVSVMAQYTPSYQANGQELWGRTVTRKEYEQVCRTARQCGFETGWFQEYGQATPKGMMGFEMAAAQKAGAAK